MTDFNDVPPGMSGVQLGVQSVDNEMVTGAAIVILNEQGEMVYKFTMRLEHAYETAQKISAACWKAEEARKERLRDL